MKVLLATEGSEFSQAAVEKCCELFGKSADNEIHVLSAAEPIYVAAEPFAVSAEYIQEADNIAQDRARSTAATAEESIRKDHPDLTARLSTKVAKGQPAQVIVEEAENWGADLIVIGSHGYGFWKRAFLGSVSNAVVHHAPCSVLIVRPHVA